MQDAHRVSPSVRWAIERIPHPDGVAYPWLSRPLSDRQTARDGSMDERFLVYTSSDTCQLCVDLARLEAAVAIARTLQRTLVLQRGIYDGSKPHLDVKRIEQLVRVISEREMLDSCDEPDRVELALICVQSTWLPWRELDSIATESRRHCLMELPAQLEISLQLGEPLRGADQVLRRLGRIRQRVLVIDDCLGTVSPSSLLDAGERELFAEAVRPTRRLQLKLKAFLRDFGPPPVLAVRADAADSHDLAATIAGTSRVACKSWCYVSTSSAAPAPLLSLSNRIDFARLVDGEDALSAEVLRLWLCAFADYFIGVANSLDSEWIRRFRVCGAAKFAEHVLLLPKGATVPVPVHSNKDADRSAGGVAARCVHNARVSARVDVRTLHCAPAASTASSDLMRRPYCQRTIVASAFRRAHCPAPTNRPPPTPPWQPPTMSSKCASSEFLFDRFISDQLPALRAHCMRTAAPGTTDRVAVIVEPRCDPALEHCVRNAALFLGCQWQLQIFHGAENAPFVEQLFSAEELVNVQLVSLGVKNLTRKAYSELLCSHWFWERVAAEHVLIFQTDSLLCRPGIDEFMGYAYVGAPWPLNEGWSRGVPWLAHSGNGGLSMRSRRIALAILDAIDFSRGEPEDVFFVEYVLPGPALHAHLPDALPLLPGERWMHRQVRDGFIGNCGTPTLARRVPTCSMHHSLSLPSNPFQCVFRPSV